MTRRLLPAAQFGAAIALVPGTATAAPAGTGAGPVTASTYTSWSASADVPMPDGSTAPVTLSRYRGDVREAWRGYVSVSVQSPCGGWPCGPMASGYAAVDGDLVQFDRQLDGASVTGVPITLTSWQLGPQPLVTRQVVVPATCTGTGPVIHDVYRGELCGGGDPCPQSLRKDASRSAAATVALGDVSATGVGTVSRGWALEVAPTAVPSVD